jgi:hypothetical protein
VRGRGEVGSGGGKGKRGWAVNENDGGVMGRRRQWRREAGKDVVEIGQS